jgi:hypothetical protein
MKYRHSFLLRGLWLVLFMVQLAPVVVGREPVAEAPADVLASPESLQAWQYEFTAQDDAFLDQVQKGCFNYFWNEVGSPACLAKDKSSDTVCSVAAVGFQLSSLPIGVERGWITREQGEERALAVLNALTSRTDNKKFGIYLHYLDENTGGQPDFSRTKYRYELQASTVDHALLQAGAMTAAVYFGGAVAKAAEPIIHDADWQAHYDKNAGYITFGWRASTDEGVNGPGEIRPWYWQRASDEERLIYFLAAGSPVKEHAVEPAAYYRLKRIEKQFDDMPPYIVSWNGSMFTYFFSHCWIGYRHLDADDPAEFGITAPRVDWFENSRRATLTHRARCIEMAKQHPTLGENRWGLAPCSFRNDYLVHEVTPSENDKDVWYDGALPPYGAGSAIMFTPKESLAALQEYRGLKDKDGKPLAWRDPQQGGFGFVDSFSLDPPYGHDDYLGIDQGPMLLAIENARTGLIWKLFMQHDVSQRAVDRLDLHARPKQPAVVNEPATQEVEAVSR